MRAYYFNSPIANIKSMAYTKADEKFLKKLNDIIDSHINDVNLDVDMIADLMNLSRPTLYRKINGLSNVTPNELIKISRLKKAAELIPSRRYEDFTRSPRRLVSTRNPISAGPSPSNST